MKHFLIIALTFISINAFSQEAYIDDEFDQDLRNTVGGWIAGDATYSIALPDGRTFWLFGDTFIGTVLEDNSIAEGAVMIRNSAIIQDGDSWTSFYNGTFEEPEDLFQSTEDTTWYWPDHGIVENDTLLIYMAKYYTDPDGPAGWNFVFAGIDVARLSYPELEAIDIINLEYTNQNHVKYGDRILVEEDYTYVYGRKEEDVNGFIIPFPHVARYPTNNWLSDWEFFDGSGWSTNPEASVQINDYQVSQQFGVFKYYDKYVMISQDIWLSPDIFSCTSDTPYGPWENHTVLFSTPELYEGTWTYNAWPHTQFTENNELLLSYNSNGDFWEIFTNVEIYRPHFVRVPMELIDDSFLNIGITKDCSDDLKLKIFPSPSRLTPTIELSGLKERYTISIIGIDGIEIWQSIIEGYNYPKVQIQPDIKATPGLYMVIVENASKRITEKFVILD